MTAEDKPSMFRSLRNSIKLIGEDPTALENVEKGLCKLELKFTQYAKSMAEVLRVHSQMKKEIEQLNETIIRQENEILAAKTDSEKAKVLVTKLKREKLRLKKRSKKSKILQKPLKALNQKETVNTNSDYGDEHKDSQGFDGTGNRETGCIVEPKLAAFSYKQDIGKPNHSKHKIQNPDQKEASMEFANSNFMFGESLKNDEHYYPKDLPSERRSFNFRIKLCDQSDNPILENIKNTQATEELEERNLRVETAITNANTNTKGNHIHESSQLQEYRNTTLLENFELLSNENQYLQGQRPPLINLREGNTPDIIMDTKEKEHFKRNKDINESGYYKYEDSTSAIERKASSLPSATSSAAEFITISEWNEEEEKRIPLKHSTTSSPLPSRNKTSFCEETPTRITISKEEKTKTLGGDVSTTEKSNKILSREKEEHEYNQSEKHLNSSGKSLPPEHFTGSTSSRGESDSRHVKAREWVYELTDGGWKMKPKTIADASDHFRMNDDINDEYKNNEQPDSHSSNTSNNSNAMRDDKSDSQKSSSTRNYKNNPHFVTSFHSKHKHPSPNIRPFSPRKPFNRSSNRYNNREHRVGRFGDTTFRGNDFRNKGNRWYSGNKNVRIKQDWIDGMCWFHYTKGQTATSCLDSKKCQGYKTFNKKK